MTHQFSAAREREQGELEEAHESRCNYAWRHTEALAEALQDGMDFKRLAAICKLATTDEAMAGRQLRRLAVECVHEWARYDAGAEEVVPPIGGWKPSKPIMTADELGAAAFPMVGEMFAHLRTGAASVAANAAPESLSVEASVAEPEEPARLRERGAI